MTKLLLRIAIFFVIFAAISINYGCTQNKRARSFGGSAQNEKFPCGRKLVAVTWKANDLWILHREIKKGEDLEVYTFTEDSSWGILNGKVTFRERLCR